MAKMLKVEQCGKCGNIRILKQGYFCITLKKVVPYESIDKDCRLPDYSEKEKTNE